MENSRKKLSVFDLIYKPSRIVEKLRETGKVVIKFGNNLFVKFVKKGNRVRVYTVHVRDLDSDNPRLIMRYASAPITLILINIQDISDNRVKAFKTWLERKTSQLIKSGTLIKLQVSRVFACIEYEKCMEFINELMNRANDYYNIEDKVSVTPVEAMIKIYDLYQHI